MNDILIQIGITTLLTFLRNLKGENNKRKWRAAVLKVHNAIQATFGDDPDFGGDPNGPGDGDPNGPGR